MDYGLSKELPADDPRLELYAKQRSERGFDDTETWSLASPIAAFILPRLKRFKEVANSYPASLTYESWMDIVQRMIDGFEQVALRDDDSFDQYKLDKGLELFSIWYLDLWW